MASRPMGLLAAAVVCLLVVVVTIGSNAERGTQAVFADAARATTGPFSAASLASPTKPTCTVLTLPTRVRFTWTGGTGQYVYTLTNGTSTIDSGSTTSTTYTRTVGAVDIGTVRFTVRSAYPTSAWVSDPPATREYGVVTGLITTCGA